MILKEGTELWVQCDTCRLKMFTGFVPVRMEEIRQQWERYGWRIRDKVTCEFCAAKAAKARTEEAS